MTPITNSNDSSSEISLELVQLNLHELPPFKLIALKKLTEEQSQMWNHRKNYWKLIGLYIDYLQTKQAGYIPKNPLDNFLGHPVFKRIISISARGFLTELNLMIAGWEVIKNFATKKKKSFYFKNPREMLIERITRLSILQVEASLSEEINQGNTLKEVRDDWANYKRLIHEKFKTSREEKSALSNLSKSEDWLDFVICAVWQHKKKGEIRKAWSDFKDAFDEEAAMWQKKDYFKEYNVKLTSTKWHQGIPVDPQSSRRITFIQHLNLPLTLLSSGRSKNDLI